MNAPFQHSRSRLGIAASLMANLGTCWGASCLPSFAPGDRGYSHDARTSSALRRGRHRRGVVAGGWDRGSVQRTFGSNPHEVDLAALGPRGALALARVGIHIYRRATYGARARASAWGGSPTGGTPVPGGKPKEKKLENVGWGRGSRVTARAQRCAVAWGGPHWRTSHRWHKTRSGYWRQRLWHG